MSVKKDDFCKPHFLYAQVFFFLLVLRVLCFVNAFAPHLAAYCCFTAALLLDIAACCCFTHPLCNRLRAASAPIHSCFTAALLLLYCCFTAALQLLYCCCAAAAFRNASLRIRVSFALKNFFPLFFFSCPCFSQWRGTGRKPFYGSKAGYEHAHLRA